jgi:hypothetical protein
MRVLISFLILSVVKILAMSFYRFEVNWLGGAEPTFKKIRLIAFLNHTSLFEPLYIGVLPWAFLWRLARKMVAPGADKTLNRPIVGIFWRLFSPNMISISRKRDKTWTKFMEAIHKKSVIVIAPEGRMKRSNGLDLQGKPMSVRSGVADVLEQLNEGRMVIAYSGGLHHVQIPGQRFPNLFKTIKLNIELIEIPEYKKQFNTEGIQWKKEVVADFQRRLENNCPNADGCPQIKLSELKES